MGKIYSYFSRPIRSFNIENRTERILAKSKPTPAPQYPSVKKQKEMVDKCKLFSEHSSPILKTKLFCFVFVSEMIITIIFLKFIFVSVYPDFMETHLKKDAQLDDRLKQVFVQSDNQKVYLFQKKVSTDLSFYDLEK